MTMSMYYVISSYVCKDLSVNKGYVLFCSVLLKSFRLDHKQALIGWGKVWKNDAKFPIHEPFELES